MSYHTIYTDAESVKNITSVNGSSITLYAIWEFEEYFDVKTAAVGDIILSNGKCLKPSVYNTYKSSLEEHPIAIVAFIGDGTVGKNGVRYGIGTNYDNGNLQWASGTGYNTDFTEIRAPELPLSNFHSNKCEGNNRCGKDDWEVIKRIDPSGTSNPSRFYPMFDFAQTYTTKWLPSEYASGWYVPSVAEFFYMVKDENSVNALKSGINIAGGPFQFFNGREFGTSSQCACADASFDAEHYMCVVQWDTYYNKLYFYANKKNNPKSTLVIRAFE